MTEDQLIELYEKTYRSWIGLEQFLSLIQLGQSIERAACAAICNDEASNYWLGYEGYNAAYRCFRQITERTELK